MPESKLRGRFTFRPAPSPEERKAVGSRPPKGQPKTRKQKRVAKAKNKRRMVAASRKANRG